MLKYEISDDKKIVLLEYDIVSEDLIADLIVPLIDSIIMHEEVLESPKMCCKSTSEQEDFIYQKRLKIIEQMKNASVYT